MYISIWYYIYIYIYIYMISMIACHCSERPCVLMYIWQINTSSLWLWLWYVSIIYEFILIHMIVSVSLLLNTVLWIALASNFSSFVACVLEVVGGRSEVFTLDHPLCCVGRGPGCFSLVAFKHTICHWREHRLLKTTRHKHTSSKSELL
jgi:hypothetical protein